MYTSRDLNELTIWSLKWVAFVKYHFEVHYCDIILIINLLILLKYCFQVSNQHAHTNDDTVQGRIYTSQGINELTVYRCSIWHCYRVDMTYQINGYDNFNSYPPIAAYMRQWIGSALYQLMACHLIGAPPPFAWPMLGYCQLDPWEQASVKC